MSALREIIHDNVRELVVDALRQGGRVIVSTYNEPLITSEWAVAGGASWYT